MKNFILSTVLWLSYIFGTSVSAEVSLEKVLHTKNSWQVVYREWSDGLQQCVAENIQGDQVEFDLVVEANSISFGLYIGEDASQDEKNYFSFQIDNEKAWTSETPFFDEGWLVLEMMDVSENVFSEVARQFREGITFKHLNASGGIISTFSLIGSNVAIIALVECENTYLLSSDQSTISQPKEMLIGRPNSNFEIGFENNTDEFLMTEFVPVGETVRDWSEMITIQALIGYRPETLESFATRFTQLVIDQCSASDQEIIWNDVQYGYNSLVLAIRCYENLETGRPEHMLVKAIQGDDALYIVQKAWKNEPNDGELEGWFEELGSFIVCGKNNDFEMCT